MPAEENSPDETEITHEHCPHFLGEREGNLFLCGKYPNACPCFLPFGSAGFCIHLDAEKWLKK